MEKINIDQLKKWFFLFRRHLPWRKNPSPYAVWVSEMMLQQTQVSVVIPYFEKWMALFPSIRVLSKTPLEQVIKAWEGLGYYSRARYLHEGARYLMTYHEGELPEDPRALQKIKGLGPYTIGAIRSFAFKKKAAAVDGNILRVFSRLFALEDPIDQPHARLQIEKLTESILPEVEPWIVMEALIELGALICQKNPLCRDCPLKTNCLAFKQNRVGDLPRKGKKSPTTLLYRLVAIIQSDRGILLKKGGKGKVMADLWEFPYFEVSQPIQEGILWQTELETTLSLPLLYQRSFSTLSHSFTRYKAFLYPHLWQATDVSDPRGYEWVSFDLLLKKPFSSGHRRILKAYIESVDDLNTIIPHSAT